MPKDLGDVDSLMQSYEDIVMSVSGSSVTETDVSPSAPIVVQTHNLTKTYRTGFWLNQRVTSLRGCNLTTYQGETFGLLGPNGAGKTTLLKILLGLVRSTNGRVRLLDRPAGRSSSEAAYWLFA